MIKQIFAAITGLALLLPGAALADETLGKAMAMRKLASESRSEALQSTTGLKLLKTWAVSDAGSATLVDVVDFLLPGTAKTVTCPAKTKCLVTVEVRSAWSVQAAADFGSGDINGNQIALATGNIFGQNIFVDDALVAQDAGSSTVIGADVSVNTAVGARVNAGKHKVRVEAVAVGEPQFMWNYSVIIRLYKR